MRRNFYKPKLTLVKTNKNRVARRDFCYLSMEKVNEIWKPINGFEGLYEVSNTGLVRSMDRVIVTKRGVKKPLKGKILRPNMNDGYAYICLSKDGKELKCKAHRLVAEAFIPNPDNLPYINHKNECKSDNRVENLEWCTKWYNDHYGTCQERVRTHLRKERGKPVIMFTLDGKFIKEYECVNDTKNDGFDNKSVIRCCKCQMVSTKGVTFRYKGDEFIRTIDKRKPIRVYVYKDDSKEYDVIDGLSKASRLYGIPVATLSWCLRVKGVYKKNGITIINKR